MSTLNPPTNISKRHELREDRVITFYARAWEFFDQNRSLVYGALVGLLVLVLALIGYVVYRGQQAEEAQQLLGRIAPLYEADQYRQALDGSAGQPGLLAIADGYGGTEAGNLARFYAADALYSLGEYDRALEYFRAYDEEADFIGASAVAGEAAVHENRGEFRQAGDLYRRAALLYANELTSPQYLLNAARAYEQGGDYDRARDAYQEITERFPDSPQAGGIDFYLARLDALSR